MADTAELLPGTLDLLILKAVSWGLEHQGLIESEWGISENNRRAKLYRLTGTGRQRLGEEVASWNRLAEAIAMALGATPQES